MKSALKIALMFFYVTYEIRRSFNAAPKKENTRAAYCDRDKSLKSIMCSIWCKVAFRMCNFFHKNIAYLFFEFLKSYYYNLPEYFRFNDSAQISSRSLRLDKNLTSIFSEIVK